jgi:hypothetical protein
LDKTTATGLQMFLPMWGLLDNLFLMTFVYFMALEFLKKCGLISAESKGK